MAKSRRRGNKGKGLRKCTKSCQERRRLMKKAISTCYRKRHLKPGTKSFGKCASPILKGKK